MQIRLACYDDLDSLIPLFNAYRQSLGQKSFPSGVRDFLNARLEENDSLILMAKDEHSAIGFVQLYPSFSSIHLKPIWYFDDCYVMPAYRERGVRELLSQKALELATETDVLCVQRTLVNANTSVLLDTDTGERHIYELINAD